MKERGKVRMQDVATIAGVSRATASYVLNGRHDLIPDETRQRVYAAARQINYRVNRLAQNLTRRRSGLIGVVLPDLKSPFFGAIADALHESINAIGLQPVFGIGPTRLDEGAERIAVLRQVLEWGVDAVLLWWEPGTFPENLCAEYLSEAEPTTVLFLGSGAPPVPEVDAVWFDLYAAGRLATECLLSAGHRHIAVLGGRRVREDPRAAAVRDLLHNNGLPEPRVIAEETPPTVPPVTLAPLETGSDATLQLGRSIVRAALQHAGSDAPTALVAVNDLMALGALRAIADLGLRVPQDISVVSCDATWVAPNLAPALTAVAMPFAALAMAGAELLARRLNHTESEDLAVQRTVLTPELILRESVAAPRTD